MVKYWMIALTAMLFVAFTARTSLAQAEFWSDESDEWEFPYTGSTEEEEAPADEEENPQYLVVLSEWDESNPPPENPWDSIWHDGSSYPATHVWLMLVEQDEDGNVSEVETISVTSEQQPIVWEGPNTPMALYDLEEHLEVYNERDERYEDMHLAINGIFPATDDMIEDFHEMHEMLEEGSEDGSLVYNMESFDNEETISEHSGTLEYLGLLAADELPDHFYDDATENPVLYDWNPNYECPENGTPENPVAYNCHDACRLCDDIRQPLDNAGNNVGDFYTGEFETAYDVEPIGNGGYLDGSITAEDILDAIEEGIENPSEGPAYVRPEPPDPLDDDAYWNSPFGP